MSANKDFMSSQFRFSSEILDCFWWRVVCSKRWHVSSWQSGSLTSLSGGPEGTDPRRKCGLSCMNERSTISAGMSVFVREVPPVFFCLHLRPALEFVFGFGTIKASFWRCTKLLPEISPVGARAAAILGEIFSTSASFPELSLEALPPREFPLEFGTIKASSWRCSGLLPGFSPVFDRTENILGEIFSTFARFPELSLEALPPRELPLGFGTIKASSWRCSGLLPGVSLVFDRTKLFLGKYFPPSPGFQSCLWKRFPLVSFLSGSVPSRHLLGAVAVYYRGSPQYSMVQKLFSGKYLPPSPAFQSCLWKRFPPVSFLSSSVPSRHLLGAVALYCRGSLQYSIVQKLFLGKIFPTFARLLELSLEALPPRELSLEFGTIKASFWRCTKLLPEVSSVFDRTEAALGEIVSTSARLPELSLEALPPREPSLGFGTIKTYFWRSTKLPPEVSPVFFLKAIVWTVSTSCATPYALSHEHVIT